MIPIYTYPKQDALDFLQKLRQRAEGPSPEILATVREVLDTVKRDGDDALFAYTKRFDKTELSSLELSRDEWESIAAKAPKSLCDALERAAQNIRLYHEKQLSACAGEFTLERGGAKLGGRVIPMKRAGIYVPGGTAAYPSSVLMCAIPARIAGVSEVVMVTPPRKNDYGLIEPAIAAAAKIAGVDRIFCVGGAQAIAALAYGTQSIPRVDCICGPGNAYVTAAKQLVTGACAIDMLAGPSEILILADDSANADYLAADLLSQAEHDRLASAVLLCTDKALAEAVQLSLEKRLSLLPREEIARVSIDNYGAILLCDTLEDAITLANLTAPEHLELALQNPQEILPRIENAGSVFLGSFSPEPVGDYYAGANHVLPTMGGARFSSQLGVYTFLKRQSTIYYDAKTLKNDRADIVTMARAEGLDAHAQSVEARDEP